MRTVVDGSSVPDKTLFVYSGRWPPGSFSALRVLHIASVSFHPAAVDVVTRDRRYRVSQTSSDEEARRVDVEVDALLTRILNLGAGLI